MHWQHKAKIMKICAYLPQGDKLYTLIQKNFGRLSANPKPRLATQVEMAHQWILSQELTIEGKRFFEVGTGHKPIVPIGFFLSGAASVITVDLNARLDYGLMQSTLAWMSENRQFIEAMYREIVNASILNERLSMIERLQSNPRTFLEEAKIRYLAPADAACTELPAESIDYHFSVTTLEHITPQAIKDIFVEAKRILADDGLALHFVDPSDHFQHQDHSITKINFLRFTEEEWLRLAGNEFAYCNRLRLSDYLALFEQLSFKVLRLEKDIDREAMAALTNGFLLAPAFKSYELDDLCSTGFKISLKKVKA